MLHLSSGGCGQLVESVSKECRTAQTRFSSPHVLREGHPSGSAAVAHLLVGLFAHKGNIRG